MYTRVLVASLVVVFYTTHALLLLAPYLHRTPTASPHSCHFILERPPKVSTSKTFGPGSQTTTSRMRHSVAQRFTQVVASSPKVPRVVSGLLVPVRNITFCINTSSLTLQMFTWARSRQKLPTFSQIPRLAFHSQSSVPGMIPTSRPAAVDRLASLVRMDGL